MKIKNITRKILLKGEIEFYNFLHQIKYFNISRKLRFNHPIILNFHSVQPYSKLGCKFMSITHPLEKFEKMILFLKENYDIVHLGKIIDDISNVKKNLNVSLTFDDGYSDNKKYVWPFLNSLNIPFTVFISVSSINQEKPIWTIHLADAIYKASCKTYHFQLPNKDGKMINYDLDFSTDALKEISRKKLNTHFMLLTPEYLNECLDIIDKVLDHPELTEDAYNLNLMSWKDVVELADGGVTIGSHGMNHLALELLDDIHLNYEISKSKEIIENNIKRKVDYFAYPFGTEGFFGERSKEYLIKAGYKAAFLNLKGKNSGKNLFELKRLGCPLNNILQLEGRMSGVLDFINLRFLSTDNKLEVRSNI